MSGLIIALIVIVVIVVILAIALIAMYNNLVRMRNRVDNAWAQVNVQLQRRLDLIPNLVETVKGYASHESGTLQAVTEARTAAMAATTPEARAEAENTMNSAQSVISAAKGGGGNGSFGGGGGFSMGGGGGFGGMGGGFSR